MGCWKQVHVERWKTTDRWRSKRWKTGQILPQSAAPDRGEGIGGRPEWHRFASGPQHRELPRLAGHVLQPLLVHAFLHPRCDNNWPRFGEPASSYRKPGLGSTIIPLHQPRSKHFNALAQEAVFLICFISWFFFFMGGVRGRYFQWSRERRAPSQPCTPKFPESSK